MKLRLLDSFRTVIDDYVSPATAAAMISKSDRTIYRWLSSERIFFISIEDCQILLTLVEAILEVRKSWVDIVTGWDNSKIHAAVVLDFYDLNRRRVLDNPNLSIDAKVAKLTRSTMRRWAEKESLKKKV